MTHGERVIVSRAMQNPDELVVVLTYTDRAGIRTRRVVSPIRFVGASSFLGLCLSREEPRRFDLARCTHVTSAPACEFEMPVPIVTLPVPELSRTVPAQVV